MTQAEVNGQRIAYSDSGGDGPAVLLSHGFLMDREMFAPQVAALAPEFRVITWDQRGFGETETDGAAFTYWDSAADATGLLDHLGIERAVLVGMSQGGFLSLRAALAHPDRVRALILIDTQAGAEHPDQVDAYRDMLAAWAGVGPGDQLAEIVAGIILGDEALNTPWIAKWQARPREGIVEPGRTLLDRDSVTDRLGEITCPALVVHGTLDAAIPVEVGEAMAKALPGCRGFVPVEGAAHAANLTHPDVVNPALLTFLRAL